MTEAQKEANRKAVNNRNKEVRERGKCVYLHRNPKTQEVFYVGIGNETRPKDKQGRSSAWRKYVDKNGYEVDVIMKGLTPKKAMSEERRLIKLYGRRCKGEGNLVNIDSGGQGVNRSNKIYEKQRCICLSTGKVYESFSQFCNEKKASLSTVRDYMFAKEARGVKFHGTEWNVRYLSKSNQIKWFSHEKMIPSNHLEIEDVYIDDEYNYELDSLEQYRIDSFIKDVEELSCYNNKLFYLYFDKGMSLRDIHKSTRIGLNSIHNSIKEIKQILKGLDVYKYKVKKTNKSKLNKLSNKTDKNSYLNMNSKEIKPTDGRKGNSRKKSIPKLPVPQGERSNKPALNQAKKSRKKQYAKKAIKNVFGSEVAMFESMAKKAKEGSYNHMKLLTDMMYEEDKDNVGTTVKAPIINFIGDSEISKKVKERIIDVTPKDE